MYYTKYGVNITKNIENEKTMLFIGNSYETEQEAENLARQKRSYVDEVFTDNEAGKRVQVGFGVPK